jgi:hypothetical protein
MISFSACYLTHELIHKYLMVVLGNCNHEPFPKLPGIVSNTTWKFCPDQYFQVVLETFPGSFGNVSCIKNVHTKCFWDIVHCTVVYMTDRKQ